VRENYEFNSIARSIDELVVLDVSRANRDIEQLASQVERLAASCFMPIGAGGGIRTIEHVYRLFAAGADKVVLNSLLFEDPAAARRISRTFGAQAVVASLDYREDSAGARTVFTANGTRSTGMSLAAAVDYCGTLDVGEVYATSINNDGTGNGFDLRGLAADFVGSQVPVIASGGAGNYRHFLDALQIPLVRAVSTANLFNFMGDGLQETRELLIQHGVPLCTWTES
jgi:cyclase